MQRFGACPGRGSYEMAREADTVVKQVRQRLAALFGGAVPERMILTFNATDSLNIAIKGALQPGDHVITSLMEHNSVRRPLNRLAEAGMISLTHVPADSDGMLDPDEVVAGIRAETRMVALAHASNVSGSLQDIEAIGAKVRESEALFLVDAAQTAGTIPIDIERQSIDLLAFPGHKGLLGPQGTGGLYVGPRAQLRPFREGGTGVLSSDPLQPEIYPYCLEAGSPNTWGLALWLKALDYLLNVTVEEVRRHKRQLTEVFMEKISAYDSICLHGPVDIDQRVAVFSLTFKDWLPDQAARVLDERYGIAVRSGLHCAPDAHRCLGTLPLGTVRVSPGLFTEISDWDRLFEAFDEMVGSGRPEAAYGF